MEWASAFQMLRQLGVRAGFDWSEEAITAVLDSTGRRPYLIQLLGAHVTDDLNAQARDRVTGGDVTAGAIRLLDEISLTGSYWGFVWNEAQWLGKLILWNLLEAPTPFNLASLTRQIRRQTEAEGVALDSSRFNKAFDERIAWLTDIADTLEIRTTASQPTGRQKGYAFSIPMIHRWLKQIADQESDFLQRATAGIAEDLKEQP